MMIILQGTFILNYLKWDCFDSQFHLFLNYMNWFNRHSFFLYKGILSFTEFPNSLIKWYSPCDEFKLECVVLYSFSHFCFSYKEEHERNVDIKAISVNKEAHFYLFIKVSFYILSGGLWGLRHNQLLGYCVVKLWHYRLWIMYNKYFFSLHHTHPYQGHSIT